MRKGVRIIIVQKLEPVEEHSTDVHMKIETKILAVNMIVFLCLNAARFDRSLCTRSSMDISLTSTAHACILTAHPTCYCYYSMLRRILLIKGLFVSRLVADGFDELMETVWKLMYFIHKYKRLNLFVSYVLEAAHRFSSERMFGHAVV
jgi:hypothetical protein